MNNERYLFRGKRIDNPEIWVEGDLIHMDESVLIASKEMWAIQIPESVEMEYAEVIPETVGLWSGITDKNGAKVFEGDGLQNPTGQFGYVEYVDGAFKLNRNGRLINLNQGFCANKEVFGNKFNKDKAVSP